MTTERSCTGTRAGNLGTKEGKQAKVCDGWVGWRSLSLALFYALTSSS
jgi:hypothetical protein